MVVCQREQHTRAVIIYQTDSINLIAHGGVNAAVATGLEIVVAGLVNGCVHYERIGPLTAINAVGQVAEVVLHLFILGDLLLVRHVGAHVHQFGTQAEILLRDFGVH